MTGNPTPSLLDAHASQLLQQQIDAALAELDGSAPLLSHMIRYHLGEIDSTGQPVPDDQRLALQGKRMRPAIAMMSARAVGGSAEAAASLGAAIELLHQFTLIHDDIQDRSPNRRHRATVWRVWGDAQAINAGDALFAASNLLLTNAPVAPDILIRLMQEFNRTTIEIVRGQVLDMSFEGRRDVPPEEYVDMITAKTAAIVRFAATGGSMLAGATQETAEQFAEFGEAVGIGFQIRDDLLGIWGNDSETGKTQGDDIRRRKQSLPNLLLRANANEADTESLDSWFAMDAVPDEGVTEILAMLDRYGVRVAVEEDIRLAHHRASTALEAVAESGAEVGALRVLLGRLESRVS